MVKINNFEQVDNMIASYINEVIAPSIKRAKTNKIIAVDTVYSTGNIEAINSSNFNSILNSNKKLILPLITFNRTSDDMSNQYLHKISYAQNKEYNYYTIKRKDNRTGAYKFIRKELPMTLTLEYDFKILASTVKELNSIKSKLLLHSNAYWNIQSNITSEQQKMFIKSINCKFTSFNNTGGSNDKNTDSSYESTFSMTAITNFMLFDGSEEPNRRDIKSYINKTIVNTYLK